MSQAAAECETRQVPETPIVNEKLSPEEREILASRRPFPTLGAEPRLNLDGLRGADSKTQNDPLGDRSGYFNAEYDVGSRIRASMLSTSARFSSRSTAMMISWKSSKVASSRHISSRASRDGYASM